MRLSIGVHASSCNARPTAWLAVAFRPGPDRFPKPTYRQRITHFTVELPFLRRGQGLDHGPRRRAAAWLGV